MKVIFSQIYNLTSNGTLGIDKHFLFYIKNNVYKKQLKLQNITPNSKQLRHKLAAHAKRWAYTPLPYNVLRL